MRIIVSDFMSLDGVVQAPGPRRVWRVVHLSSYVLFWTATFHLLTAGTDARNPVSRSTTAAVIVIVVFLTLVRALAGRGRASARSRTTSARAPRAVVTS